MLKRIKKSVLQRIHYQQKYYENHKMAPGHQVKFFNYWPIDITDNWFTNFLRSKGFLERYPDLSIGIFSVFGPKYIIELDRSDVKIFFNGENVFSKENGFTHYQDLAMDTVDIALGFRDLSSPKYTRFPLWLTYMFEPDSTEDDIRKLCDKYSNQKISNRERFAVHISRHDDFWGVRSGMVNTLSKIERVDCPGSFLNNTDELKKEFSDNKIEFLKNYKFNICPENSDIPYYVTEKVPEAIMAGCIPVYWGANGNPDHEIFNQDAIIYWNGDEATIEKINELHHSEKKFKDFAKQPRLKPDAADKIIEMFKNFEEKLLHLFEQKSHHL